MATPINTAQDALNAAQSFKQSFSTIRDNITSNPSRIEEFLQPLYNSGEIPLFQALGQRILASYTRAQNAIPNVTEEQLQAISAQLSKASNILEEIEQLQINALMSSTANPNPTNILTEDNNTGNSISPNNAASNQTIRDTQDEEFQVSSYQDQLTTLESETVTLNASEAFNKILPFFSKINTYVKNTIFINQDNQAIANSLLKNAHRKIERAIEIQIKNEKEQSPVPSKAARAPYENLKQALEKVNQSAQPSPSEAVENTQNVHKAFQTLDEAQKTSLFNALSSVLVTAGSIQKPLNENLKKLSLSIWGGSAEQKIKALDNVLKTLTPAPLSERPKKESERMEEEFDQVKEGTVQHSTARITTPSRSLAKVNPLFAENIEKLQRIIEVLHNSNSMGSFSNAAMLLTLLESKEAELTFGIGNSQPQKVAACGYFHLHQICQQEHEEKPGSNENYGKEAMLGQQFATNEERCRALQRTIVELALQNLEEAILASDLNTIKGMLEILSNMQMNIKDMPKDKGNLAHILFANMYFLHCNVRKTNSGLADPQLDSEFGRNAFFSLNPHAVLPATKVQTIQELRKELKAAWKI